MDILSQYNEQLDILKKQLTFLYSVPYPKRDFPKIAVLEDEIQDVTYAITLMTNPNNFAEFEGIKNVLQRKYF